eukprot:511939_1
MSSRNRLGFVFAVIVVANCLNHNWLCNKSSIWTSDGDWLFSNSSCSSTSSNHNLGTVLWLGDSYKESLLWNNYKITVVLKLIEGEDTGIIFRAQNSVGATGIGQKYMFLLFDSHVRLYKSSNWTILHSQLIEEHYFVNKTRNITIYVNENRFTFFIDGHFTFEYTDSCYPIFNNGSVGIRSYQAIATFYYLNVDLDIHYIQPQQYNTLNTLQQIALYNVYNSTNGNHWNNKWNLTKIKTTELCYSLCGIMCLNFDGITQIVSLTLNSNNLYGKMIEDIQYFKYLMNIDLSNNMLKGPIPDIFDTLTSLVSMHLINDELNSTLPESIQYSPSLAFVVISSNSLIGNIDVFSYVTTLRWLHLNNNHFIGSISDNFCNANKLLEVDFSNKQINGTIPSCIGNWTKLLELYIIETHVSGKLPQSICNLSIIGMMEISQSNITSSIPSCIGDLSNLFRLTLSGNRLTSSIPNGICELIHLKDLVLSQNDLTDTVPTCIWSKLSELKTIYLNSNRLTHIYIDEYPPNIQIIAISDNILHGELAPFDENLTQLKKKK